jgi:HAD superfamily hydrolase (TIGR01509 family)
MRPQPDRLERLLLLDIGGVLLENVLRHEWWQRLALRSDRSAAELEQIFTDNLKPALWTGKMSPSEFWKRLAVIVDPDAPDLNRQMECELALDLKPLPAASLVADWAREVHVALLSNHVSLWLDSFLVEYALQDACDFILISDQMGCRKPDPRTFQSALDRWNRAAEMVLYADDNQNNLAAASEAGMTTLLAAPRGQWESHVDTWIQRESSKILPKRDSASLSP